MKSETPLPSQFGHDDPITIIDQSTLQNLLPEGQLLNLEIGETIDDNDSSKVFVLLSGGIRLLRQSPGKEQPTTQLLLEKKGQTFGRPLILEPSGETEVARATKKTTVARLNRSSVEAIFNEKPEVKERLTQWECLRLAACSLGCLAQHSPSDARKLQKLLSTGHYTLLSSGQTEEVSATQAIFQGFLCTGAAEIQTAAGNVVRRIGPEVKLSEKFFELPCTVRALEESLIFVGSKDLAQVLELSASPSQKSDILANTDAPSAQVSDSITPESGQKTAQAAKEDAAEYKPDSITWLKRKFKQYPLMIQQSAMDCGAACLSMVNAYYGKSVPMNKLRELAKVTNQGTDLKSLSDAGETLGYSARGIKANYEGLQRLTLPLICHWGTNHYVVIFEIGELEVLIADPADDLVRLSKQAFLERFSGYCLELAPTANLSYKGTIFPSFGRYTTLLTSHKRALLDIALASLLIQILMLATPLFTQVVVDKVLIHQSLSMLNILLIGMVFLSAFQIIVAALRSYFMAFTALKIDQSLFVQFYKHVLSLPLSFFEERTQGDVMTRFGENRKIRELMSGSTLTTLIDVAMAVLYLAIIFSYNFWFGLFTTAYVLVFALIAAAVAPIMRNIRRRTFQKDVASNALLLESLRGIEKIKSAATENRTRWAWEVRFVDALNVNFKGTLWARATQLLCELIHIAGNVLLLWFGAHLVIQETISIGQLMALNLMVARITDPILHVVDIWDDLQDVVVALERLNDVLEQKPEEEEKESKIVLPPMSSELKFDSVTFRYPGNSSANALQNVSLTIKAGQMVGIVGRSGCGKSTLLKLMQGLYSATSGRISIDGHDISHVALASLRTQIGVVAQHDYLFRGSIRESIAYYKPEASLEEVIEAAKLAGMHDFISTLPRGYDYELTEGGGNLSGGQRQRLAIARAVVHAPKLLIFDEATSFLDSESERAIQNSIVNLRSGRSVVVVAHRLSTIRDADIILVMDRGQIVETGNHQSLLAQRGLYFYLCQQQTVD